jgi:F-type H+-transporting ATPase subunit delta
MVKQISALAKTYAHSLIEVDENYNDILSDLSTVNDVILSSNDFRQTMNNPSVSLKTKYEIIDEIFKKELNEKVLNFIKILIDKNRFNDFEQIVQAYSNEINEINNVKLVQVVSAVELSDNQKQNTIEKLKARLNKDIKVNWILDKKIIGGLVVKIDDDVIDMSLKNKLDKLSKI